MRRALFAAILVSAILGFGQGSLAQLLYFHPQYGPICSSPAGPVRCPPGALPQAYPAPAPTPPGVTRQPVSVAPQVNVYHLNPVMQQRSVMDRFVECTKDKLCNTVIGAIATSAGVPSGALQAATFFATQGSTKPGSEETTFSFEPPLGHSICSIEVTPISLVPLGGDRATSFSMVATPQLVNILVWTPYDTASRTWWDGTITVVSIPTALISKVRFCGIVAAQKVVYVCRGDGRNKHGQQACRTQDFGGLF